MKKISSQQIISRMLMLKNIAAGKGWSLKSYDRRTGAINLFHQELSILFTLYVTKMTVGIVFPGLKPQWRRNVSETEINNILSDPLFYT